MCWWMNGVCVFGASAGSIWVTSRFSHGDDRNQLGWLIIGTSRAVKVSPLQHLIASAEALPCVAAQGRRSVIYSKSNTNRTISADWRSTALGKQSIRKIYYLIYSERLYLSRWLRVIGVCLCISCGFTANGKPIFLWLRTIELRTSVESLFISWRCGIWMANEEQPTTSASKVRAARSDWRLRGLIATPLFKPFNFSRRWSLNCGLKSNSTNAKQRRLTWIYFCFFRKLIVETQTRAGNTSSGTWLLELTRFHRMSAVLDAIYDECLQRSHPCWLEAIWIHNIGTRRRRKHDMWSVLNRSVSSQRRFGERRKHFHGEWDFGMDGPPSKARTTHSMSVFVSNSIFYVCLSLQFIFRKKFI